MRSGLQSFQRLLKSLDGVKVRLSWFDSIMSDPDVLRRYLRFASLEVLRLKLGIWVRLFLIFDGLVDHPGWASTYSPRAKVGVHTERQWKLKAESV